MLMTSIFKQHALVMGLHQNSCQIEECASTTDLISNAAVFFPPVFAEQKLQPLCCYLLPASGAAQSPPLQLPRRTAARRPPATAQHHRGADCGQGERGFGNNVHGD